MYLYNIAQKDAHTVSIRQRRKTFPSEAEKQALDPLMGVGRTPVAGDNGVEALRPPNRGVQPHRMRNAWRHLGTQIHIENKLVSLHTIRRSLT